MRYITVVKTVGILIAVMLLISLPCCKVKSNDNNDGNGKTKIAKFDLWSLSKNETKLRGANIYQRRVYPELDGTEYMGPGPIGPPYNQQDFYNLAALGANYVNISHPGIYSENAPYELDDAVLQNLVKLVDMIGKADMFAVISFRTGPGRSEFTFFWGEDWFDKSYFNDRIWKGSGAQNAFAAMWKKTAEHFAGNPYVVGYDLMVEPNSNDVWLDTWDPEEFYGNYSGTLYDWNQLFPRISDAIREVDTTTPILVGGMSYSMVQWLPYVIPTTDEKTVYMVHQYDPHVYTHQEPGENIHYPGTFDADYDGQDETVDKNWLADLLSAVDDFKINHGVPVSCNEYGLVRWTPDAEVFMDDLASLFEERRMNYALWVWDPAFKLYTDVYRDFNFRFGPDPDNNTEVANALQDVIKKYWQKNKVRPANTEFVNR